MQVPNPTEPEEFCMKGFDTKESMRAYISDNQKTEEKRKVQALVITS
jgi:hypothetical protein